MYKDLFIYSSLSITNQKEFISMNVNKYINNKQLGQSL